MQGTEQGYFLFFPGKGRGHCCGVSGVAGAGAGACQSGICSDRGCAAGMLRAGMLRAGMLTGADVEVGTKPPGDAVQVGGTQHPQHRVKRAQPAPTALCKGWGAHPAAVVLSRVGGTSSSRGSEQDGHVQPP